MNCYDCTTRGESVSAVAVCMDCGAAVCATHAQVAPRWLTYTVTLNRTMRAEPPTRTIRCSLCQCARHAVLTTGSNAG